MEIITRKDAQKKGQRYFYEGLVCDKGHKDYWLTKRNVCSVWRRIYEHEYAWKKNQLNINIDLILSLFVYGAKMIFSQIKKKETSI